MKSKIPVFISAILVFSFLAGCSPAGKKAGTVTPEPLLATNELDAALKETSGFQLVEKNEELELYADGKTTEIAVKVLATGQMWYSNPQDRDSDPVAEPNNKTKLSSQIDLVYNNEADKESGMNNFTDAIDIGQYEFARIENGLRVTYTVGKQEKIYIVPQVITVKRFEETILSKLDAEQKDALLSRYTLYSLKDAESDEIKADLIAKYPKIKDEDLYVITENLADFVMEKLEKIVSPTGYSYADLVKDNEENGAEIPAQPTAFKIPVDYTIDGSGFVAKVRTQYITCPDDVKITDLKFLSFFGAAGLKEEGYLFVPDGCGALIKLNNGKNDLPPYKNALYGEDQTSMNTDRLKSTKQSYLPVYGIKKGNDAFLAVVESGDAIASVNASVSGILNGYNYVYPSFELTQKIKMSVPYGRSNDLNIFQKSKFDEDLTIRYFFLNGNEANYTGMALKYQDYLLKSGKLKKHTTEKPPFYLELIGAVEYKDSVMGLPVKKIKALTTFNEAAEIVNQLNKGGVGRVVLRYLGWANDGLQNYSMNRIDIESRLGGKKGLQNLQSALETKGNQMFVDLNLQYIYKKKLFDGYSSLFDAPKTILGETAYNSINNLATGVRVSKINLITPSKYETYADDTIKSLNKLDIRQVSLSGLGTDVYSDFNKSNVIDRQDSYEISAGIFKKYVDDGYQILSDGANAYALANVSHLINIPGSSNRFYCIDEDVPFYQIVLHGIVPYAEEAVNMSSDYRNSVLKMMETGSNIHFKWMYAQNRDLKKIDTENYAVSYREWIEEAIGLYNQTSADLQTVQNSRITGHEMVSANISRTQYDNGTSIYVNYGEAGETVNGVSIGAQSYKVVKGAVK